MVNFFGGWEGFVREGTILGHYHETNRDHEL